tara:strand:- start:164 stop:463 length:300 start_codon:yes stop_codon:yes gene_type:complete
MAELVTRFPALFDLVSLWEPVFLPSSNEIVTARQTMIITDKITFFFIVGTFLFAARRRMKRPGKRLPVFQYIINPGNAVAELLYPGLIHEIPDSGIVIL